MAEPEFLDPWDNFLDQLRRIQTHLKITIVFKHPWCAHDALKALGKVDSEVGGNAIIGSNFVAYPSLFQALNEPSP